MKLLHVLPSLERRGAQMFAAELWRGLAGMAVDQALILLHQSSDEVGLGADTAALGYGFGSSTLTHLLALRRAFADAQPEVVLAHGGEPFKYAVLARGRAAAPKILYRKIGLSEQWLGRFRMLKLPFQRWLMQQADAVSAVGEATRREAIDLFRADPRKVRVIYRGVNPARFVVANGTRAQMRNVLGVGQAVPVLIAVGALGWEKNLAAMLRVLVEVRRTVPEVVLLLVGAGPERPALESLTKMLGLSGAVRFLGMRPDVSELLATADLLLLTSLTEGVPGVLIEAGLAGRASVAWDVAGTREVVRDGATGRVTPYLDEAAFAVAIIELLDAPEKAEALGKAAREFCTERFGIEKCADAHVHLFEEMGVGGLRGKAKGER